MASASAVQNDHPGLRQRTMDLMPAEMMAKYNLPFHRAVRSIMAFVPYGYKELKDVDIGEYSAMHGFGMIQYVTSLQHHCVPADLFFWGIFNTYASDERLLVTGVDGRPNVIGWQEIMTAFRSDHSEEDEFHGAKIMHRQLLPYRPAHFLPESVEKNVNKELVSGKDYEEVLYYREAAPYGPTYYMMTLIAEVFWSHSRSNRFLMPMVYAYLRALHGHPYNWAKAILKSLKSEISYLQKEARAVKKTRKTVQVVWVPVFMHLLYTYRHRIFVGTEFAEAKRWVHWRLMTKEGDITLADLSDKFPNPIVDFGILRNWCKLADPDDLHEADLACQAEGTTKKLLSKKKQVHKVTLSSVSDDEDLPLTKKHKPDTQ
ncbi:hypothetical protein R1sor_026967 [Riccia sorocarpa]|uniref:Uncharacterized protein n=1 Tax=Riccia sorocarpa TaxID=122646 RepID=A0ABD3GH31_9MARC